MKNVIARLRGNNLDNILGTFNKAVVRLENLAEANRTKAGKKAEKAYDLRGEADDLLIEAGKAKATAESIRKLIGSEVAV